MLIGTWDISNAGARQSNVTFGYSGISNNSEWSRGSPAPFLIKNDIGFKSLKIVLVVKGSGREEILHRCSEILSHCLSPVELTLDNYHNRYFYGIIKKHSAVEQSMKRWHTLTLEFDCYEYGNEVTQTFSGSTEFTLNNTGNIPTATTIEITPQIGAASIVLSGICRDYDTGEDLPVTIRELTTGKTVIIDGETGLITQDGEVKAADVDIWSLPVLLPGENKITVNNNRMDITLRFRPRFM